MTTSRFAGDLSLPPQADSVNSRQALDSFAARMRFVPT
jgi:hypothetical protein